MLIVQCEAWVELTLWEHRPSWIKLNWILGTFSGGRCLLRSFHINWANRGVKGQSPTSKTAKFHKMSKRRRVLHLMFFTKCSQETEGNKGMLLEDHSESLLVKREIGTSRDCVKAGKKSQAGLVSYLLASPFCICLHHFNVYLKATGVCSANCRHYWFSAAECMVLFSLW